MPRRKSPPKLLAGGRPVVLHPVPARRFYFAYGSNLHIKSMQQRCESARKVGALKLYGWRLTFRHVADIEEGEPTDYVPGGLWEITPADEIKLDRYEGVRYGQRGEDGGGSYCKLSFPILTKRDQAVHDVLVYRMNTRTGVLPPGEWYYNTLVRGYKDFGLDLAKLDEALVRAWDEKKLTEALASRWNRSGRQSLARPPLNLRKQTMVQMPMLDVDQPEQKQGEATTEITVEPAPPEQLQLPEPEAKTETGATKEKEQDNG